MVGRAKFQVRTADYWSLRRVAGEGRGLQEIYRARAAQREAAHTIAGQAHVAETAALATPVMAAPGEPAALAVARVELALDTSMMAETVETGLAPALQGANTLTQVGRSLAGGEETEKRF